ncbi:MAG TPA: Coq4 family protein [Bdellovibrionota bacterium]
MKNEIQILQAPNPKTMQLSLLNRLRMIKAFIGLVRDVERTDEVFAFSERIPEDVLKPELDRLATHPQVAKVMKERPLLPHFNLQDLRELPAGTLGREYSEFMIRRNLSPDFYPKKVILDSPGKYFRFHFYQTHDLWHVLTGFKADPGGELGLQAFYFAQHQLPLPIMLIAAGLLNSMIRDPGDAANRLSQIARGWKMGQEADLVFGFDWAAHWHLPLREVRKILKVEARGSAVPDLATPSFQEAYA